MIAIWRQVVGYTRSHRPVLPVKPARVSILKPPLSAIAFGHGAVTLSAKVSLDGDLEIFAVRLLIVEDDKILGSSLKRAFEKHAYGADCSRRAVT